MKKSKKDSNKFAQLRKKVENSMIRYTQDIKGLSKDEIQKLINDLEVHRAELEIQNEELIDAQDELEILRDKYFDLYESAPVGYISINNRGIVTEANLEAARLMGNERRFIIKSPLTRFIIPEHRNRFTSHFNDLLENGSAKTCEIGLLKPDGSVWHVQMDCIADMNEANKVDHLRIVIIDIHQRRLLEHQLIQSEQKYRHLVETAPSGIYEIDFDKMGFMNINEAVLRITGYSRDDMMSMNPLDILTPESKKLFLERLEIIKSGRQPSGDVEFEIFKGDGSTTWVSLNIYFHKRDKRILKATVVIHDIKERKEMERKIRRSEKRFRTLADHSPAIIARYDMDLRHLYVNPVVESITGKPRIEFIGKTNEEIGMPAKLCKKLRKFQENILETGLPGKLEFEFNGPNDKYYFEMFTVPEFSDDGIANSLLIIAHDITTQVKAIRERDRLLEALRLEQDRLQAIIASAPQGIVVTDAEGRIIMTNAVADKICKRPIPRFKPYRSHSVLQLYNTKGKTVDPRNLPLTRSALDGEISINKELIIKYPDRTNRNLLVNTSPIKNTDGKITGAVGIFQDISDQKKAYEKESQEEAERYAANIVETIHNPILLLDDELNIITANHSYYQFFRVEPEETIGRPFHKLGSGQWNIPELRDLLKEILQKNTTLRDYLIDYYFDKIGHRYIRLNAHKMKGVIETGRKIVISISDVTKQIFAEHEQIEYQEKLRSLSIQLTQSEEKERQRIASGLHDSVVQALTATRMKLNIIQENLESKEDVGGLDEISELIGNSIEEIRSLSFELSSPMLNNVGLVQTIKWFIGIIREKYDFSVEFDYDRPKYLLTENIRNILFQAVRELLNNVLKHAKAKQTSISIRQAGDTIEIEIKDDGIGFDTKNLYRAIDQTKGFGLFNLRERLDFFGGSLKLYSNIGKGTRIIITAPLTEKIEKEKLHGDKNNSGR
ncbi:MAG: PAS domain S-box protein [Calditrichaceae bacterium]